MRFLLNCCRLHQVILVQDLVMIQSLFEDLGSILNVDTTMAFNFMDMMNNIATNDRRYSRHDSTASLIPDFPYDENIEGGQKRTVLQTRKLSDSEGRKEAKRKGVLSKIVKFKSDKMEDTQEEVGEDEVENTEESKSKRKSVLSKLKRSKLGKMKRTDDDDVDEEDDQEEEEDRENWKNSKIKDVSQKSSGKSKLSKGRKDEKELQDAEMEDVEAEELNEDKLDEEVSDNDDDGDDDKDIRSREKDNEKKQRRTSRIFQKVPLMKSKGRKQSKPAKKHFRGEYLYYINKTF